LKDIIGQFDVLAQGPDLEGWLDFLVILVMAALWAIGGLIKAASRKNAQRREQEGPVKQPRPSWQERLARKAEEMQRAAEAKGREAAERVRRLQEQAAGSAGRPARPPAGRISIRQDQRGKPVMVYEKPQRRDMAARQQQAARQQEARRAIAAARTSAKESPPVGLTERRGIRGLDVEALPGVTLEPTAPLEPEQRGPEIPRESAGFEPAALLDYGDPDALKKAILHYEILGKPIALRDPSESERGL
jgi:hypothetical protein